MAIVIFGVIIFSILLVFYKNNIKNFLYYLQFIQNKLKILPLYFYLIDFYYTFLHRKLNNYKSKFSKYGKIIYSKINFPKLNFPESSFENNISNTIIVLFCTITGGFLVSILFAWFSNTLHWTWIFDYIILTIGLIVIAILTIIYKQNRNLGICFLFFLFSSLFSSYIFFHNYHNWVSADTVFYNFIILTIVIFIFISLIIYSIKAFRKYFIIKIIILFVLIVLLFHFSTAIYNDHQFTPITENETFPYYDHPSKEKVEIKVPKNSNFTNETFITGYIDKTNGIQIAVKYNGTDLDEFIRGKNEDRNKYAFDLTGTDLPLGTLGWKTTTGWYHILIINPKFNQNNEHEGVIAVFIGSNNEKKAIEMAKTMIFKNETDRWDINGTTC